MGKGSPRGVAVLEDDWGIPVILGVDAESRAAAVAFGIDHNSSTLMGGGLELTDLLTIWDEDGSREVLDEAEGGVHRPLSTRKLAKTQCRTAASATSLLDRRLFWATIHWSNPVNFE